LSIEVADVRKFIEAGEPTPELQAVLDNLAARGLRDYVAIDYNVIRGLAYYTGVVFEAFDRKGEFRAIAGGGRYDQLVKLLSQGKVDLTALGFGMGDVVLLELLKSVRLRLTKSMAWQTARKLVACLSSLQSQLFATSLQQQLKERAA
jgi:histidyl-tRNA synthetase